MIGLFESIRNLIPIEGVVVSDAVNVASNETSRGNG